MNFLRTLSLIVSFVWMGSTVAKNAIGNEVHPFHICVGEMEWNKEGNKWEISLRLHASDLQTAVSREAGKRIEIDPSKKESRELVRYLTNHFFLSSNKGTDLDQEKRATNGTAPEGSNIKKERSSSVPEDKDLKSRMNWVGMETDRGWLWIYIEIIPPKTEAPLFLTHSLLLDDVDDQKNTIVIIQGEKRNSLKFVKGTERHPMP